MENSDTGGTSVPGIPGRTGVDEVDIVDDPAESAVAVPEDDDVGLGTDEALAKRGREGVGIDDVLDQNSRSGEFPNLGFAPSRVGIIVPGDDGDWRDEFELRDERGMPDVTRVENVVNSVEKAGDAGIEVIVGVGDEPDSHGKRGACRTRRSRASSKPCALMLVGGRSGGCVNGFLAFGVDGRTGGRV